MKKYEYFFQNTVAPVIISLAHDAVCESIKEYGTLKKGWDFGEGDEISQETISRALSIYGIAKMYGLEIEPHPAIDGSIYLVCSLVDKDYFLDIKISKETLAYSVEKGIGAEYEIIEKKKNIRLDEILAKILEIRIKCNTLEYFHFPNTATGKKGTATMHFLTTWTESQSSNEIARNQLQDVYATTSQDSTNPLPLVHQ